MAAFHQIPVLLGIVLLAVFVSGQKGFDDDDYDDGLEEDTAVSSIGRYPFGAGKKAK